MTAQQILEAAKRTGIFGALVRKFRNGQELREYDVPKHGKCLVRAFPHEHNPERVKEPRP